MSRRFTLVTVALAAIVAFLVGAIFAGGISRSSVSAVAPKAATSGHSGARGMPAAATTSLINFADVVERINPAVVNIDATTRARDSRRKRGRSAPEPPDQFDQPFDFNGPRQERDAPHRGAGSGFIIDADG